MIAVTIRELSKHFGDHLVLDHISLRIEPGELFFLLGPSGCGKTTLLRHVAGFYFPDRGQILFDDQDVSRVPPHKRGTGMMFQSYALWPHLSVAGNVAFGLEERRTARPEINRRVDEALASVGLSALADRKINSLSGGQQQRVALARALVIRPRCLLLDEPLSNLDARLRLQMRGEIRRVCKEFGLTAIYVTHDQKEALSIADRVAVLERGHLAQVGPPQDIYRRPRTRAVADFIGESNFLPGHAVSPADGSGGWRIETALGHFVGRKSDPDWDLHTGEAVLLSIRPECWTLGQPDPAGIALDNSVRGRIGRSIYLGEAAEHEFAPAAPRAAALKVLELNPRATGQPAEGVDGVELAARVVPEDVVVLHP